MRIEFQSTDFIPLERFELGWRWTDPRAAVLPPADRARIRALGPARAAELGPRAAYLCDERRELPGWLRADHAPDKVRERLCSLHIDPRTRIVVSWDERTAVVTDWELFCRYWDDFCYPSSDDVTILPLSEEWVLCYDHHEVFRLDHPDHAV